MFLCVLFEEFSFFIQIFSEIPGWEFWTPSVFRDKYLSGTLEKFDFVFTYSSVEHSGLGKSRMYFETVVIVHKK